MSYGRWPKYVSVAEKKAKAEKKIQQLRKKNPNLKPVILTGKALATTWWGKSWNKNLERYADFSNRIGRGKSYVRHMAVLDLHIKKGTITALVQGSTNRPYKVAITIAPIARNTWQKLQKQSTTELSSLPDLLAGKFPKGLQDIFMAKGQGLFPSVKEIELTCDCPDWATMCKHVAATLYGVGARLDEDPSLFFTLRQVSIDELVSQAVQEKTASILTTTSAPKDTFIADDNLGDLFGITLDTEIDFTSTKKPKKGKARRKPVQPKEKKKTNPNGDLILAIIQESKEPVRVKDLAEISGLSSQTIYPILTRLKKQGQVVSPKWGHYSPAG